MRRPAALVLAITAVGAALRIALAGQDMFADELSTYWIVSGHGLGGVISTVHTDAEITPPLYFALAWLSTRISLAPEWLRMPSLIAGIATIPAVYAVGARTVGRTAAVVATALTALSPFMLYYSGEARGYALMMCLVVLSTLAMLLAVDTRRWGWWALYAAASAGAVYSHYTSVFALGAQFAWLLWAHPEARRAALIANAGAAIAFLPWWSGLRGDLNSPTTDILSALQPFTFGFVRASTVHWLVGYPYINESSSVRHLPGLLALILLAVAVVASLALLVPRLGAWRRLDRRIVLVALLALAVPVGELVASAVSSNLYGTRNLAASWPYVALTAGAVLASPGPRLRIVTIGLAVVAFAIGAVRILGPDFQRPHYREIASLIDRTASPQDVVVDGPTISPAGVPTPFDVAFKRPHRRFQLAKAKVRYNPFRILGAPAPIPDVVRQAAAAAAGHRLYLILLDGNPTERLALDAVPPGYRLLSHRVYGGISRLGVYEYAAP